MDDLEFCQRALREVSRTFSRPIELLPDELGTAVTCGYLLCRIVDTVEDHAALELAERDRLYEAFLDVLERGAEPSRFTALFASVPGSGPERDLAMGLDRVLRVFGRLPGRTRDACTTQVAEMTRGMAIYSHRAAGNDGIVALRTLSDLERYCYFVAGTVGHMLTDLFVHALEDLPPERERAMRRNAEEFGLGLQLVNVLKDVSEDRTRSVSFLPRQLCLEAGLPLSELLRPERRAQAHRALAPVFSRARDALDAAFEYALAIPPVAREIRLFCLLPIWMAVRTLLLLDGNDAQVTAGSPVKISRQEVMRLIADCTARCDDDVELRKGWDLLHARPVDIGLSAGC